MSLALDNNTLEVLNSTMNSIVSFKFKIVFLGDQGVGKTCIINRFIFDIFEEECAPTIGNNFYKGIDFISKNFVFDDKIFRF